MIGLDLKNHFSLASATSVEQICHDPLSGIGIKPISKDFSF